MKNGGENKCLNRITTSTTEVWFLWVFLKVKGLSLDLSSQALSTDHQLHCSIHGCIDLSYLKNQRFENTMNHMTVYYVEI